MINEILKKQTLKALEGFGGGPISLRLKDGSTRTVGRGDRPLAVTIHNDVFFRKFVLGGDMGLGESYMDGDWSTDDLPGLLSEALLARDTLPLDTPLSMLINTTKDAWHWTRKNTRLGAKRNLSLIHNSEPTRPY